MRMSAEGRRSLVEAFEGLRTAAYRDAVGVWTIGYGHTSAIGAPEVGPGLTITAAEADSILAADLTKVERGVEALLMVAPSQREFDALVSFAFNVGVGALRSSSVLKAFNAGRSDEAADRLLAWDHAGGRVLPGLTRRRRAERAWFMGDAPAAPDPSAKAPSPLARLLSWLRGLLRRLAPKI